MIARLLDLLWQAPRVELALYDTARALYPSRVRADVESAVSEFFALVDALRESGMPLYESVLLAEALCAPRCCLEVQA